ncbi:aminoacyl-tRNA hydrolase [Bacilli bacterium]|nr:aminoacyl-tRNA hydrolase [Bacilli bacterium]
MYKLIVGLGNYPKEYSNTRHNIGFEIIDMFCEKLSIELDENKFDGLIKKYSTNNVDYIICKPQTYMNLSGRCVKKICDFYKILPNNVLIIHDDIDTELGKIKFRKNGGSGGQNGIKNIIEMLGNENFYRIKIGVSRPEKGFAIDKYVLSKFNDIEISAVNSIKEKVVILLEEIVANPQDNFLKQFN